MFSLLLVLFDIIGLSICQRNRTNKCLKSNNHFHFINDAFNLMIIFFLLEDVMLSGSCFSNAQQTVQNSITNQKKQTVAPSCFLNSLYNWFIICYKQQLWQTNTKAMTKYIRSYHFVTNPLDTALEYDRPYETNNSRFGYRQKNIQWLTRLIIFCATNYNLEKNRP